MLEGILGMELYTKSAGFELYGAIKNKDAFLGIVGLFGVYFIGLLFYNIF